MKKFLLFLLIASFTLKVQATTHVVTVANFSYSPNNIPNVVVGDIIRFERVSGSHTTTCDPSTQGANNSLPAGAATWDAPLNVGSTVFQYTVTVAGTYNYWCKPHRAGGMTGSFTATDPVPVTLSEFKVSSANNKASLSWKTLTELNTSYFSVRKSKDGSNYTEIGRVPAAGTSNTIRSYTFADNTISNNEKYAYYLIATVDIDGSTQISETRIFKNPSALPKLITSLSPNPISKPGHLMLKFNSDKTGSMSVRVINMQGKTVIKTEMYAVTGVNNGHCHLGDLPAGTYTMLFSLNGLKETHKVVVE